MERKSLKMERNIIITRGDKRPLDLVSDDDDLTLEPMDVEVNDRIDGSCFEDVSVLSSDDEGSIVSDIQFDDETDEEATATLLYSMESLLMMREAIIEEPAFVHHASHVYHSCYHPSLPAPTMHTSLSEMNYPKRVSASTIDEHCWFWNTGSVETGGVSPDHSSSCDFDNNNLPAVYPQPQILNERLGFERLAMSIRQSEKSRKRILKSQQPNCGSNTIPNDTDDTDSTMSSSRLPLCRSHSVEKSRRSILKFIERQHYDGRDQVQECTMSDRSKCDFRSNRISSAFSEVLPTSTRRSSESSSSLLEEEFDHWNDDDTHLLGAE